MDLDEALERVGRNLAERESPHRDGLTLAKDKATLLHRRVENALARYHAAIDAAGAAHLRVELTAPRLDEKHVRSYEFDVRRGRHRALFVLKSRGELTLVGPFRAGKTEGPCRSFPVEAEGEITTAVVAFVSAFLEEAATP